MGAVMGEFRVKEFPRVKAGLVTEEECLLQFSEGINEAASGSNSVTLEHFYDYYSDLSGGIPSDDWFVYMMENTWNVCEDEEKEWIMTCNNKSFTLRMCGKMKICSNKC